MSLQPSVLLHINFHALTAILTFRRVRKIAKSDSYLRHVRVSVRSPVYINQLGSHWTEFCKICCGRLLWKPLDHLETQWKSNKNVGEFTGRPKYFVLLRVTLYCDSGTASEMASGYYDSREGMNIRRTRHNGCVIGVLPTGL